MDFGLGHKRHIVPGALPKPDGPDYIRFFRAQWGKWPAALEETVVK
jgi:hypothetical protein